MTQIFFLCVYYNYDRFFLKQCLVSHNLKCFSIFQIFPSNHEVSKLISALGNIRFVVYEH